jgi:hypothetical protein
MSRLNFPQLLSPIMQAGITLHLDPNRLPAVDELDALPDEALPKLFDGCRDHRSASLKLADRHGPNPGESAKIVER